MSHTSKVFGGIIAIIIVLVLVFQYAGSRQVSLPFIIGSVAKTDMPGMQLKTYMVPDGTPAPTMAFTITKDSMDGWDVHVTTTNFTFAPEKLNMAPAPGEGHAHLFIDGVLVVMLGPWYHFDSIAPGTHTVKVDLVNNDHSVYMNMGNPVSDTQMLTI